MVFKAFIRRLHTLHRALHLPAHTVPRLDRNTARREALSQLDGCLIFGLGTGIKEPNQTYLQPAFSVLLPALFDVGGCVLVLVGEGERVPPVWLQASLHDLLKVTTRLEVKHARLCYSGIC